MGDDDLAQGSTGGPLLRHELARPSDRPDDRVTRVAGTAAASRRFPRSLVLDHRAPAACVPAAGSGTVPCPVVMRTDSVAVQWLRPGCEASESPSRQETQKADTTEPGAGLAQLTFGTYAATAAVPDPAVVCRGGHGRGCHCCRCGPGPGWRRRVRSHANHRTVLRRCGCARRGPDEASVADAVENDAQALFGVKRHVVLQTVAGREIAADQPAAPKAPASSSADQTR